MIDVFQCVVRYGFKLILSIRVRHFDSNSPGNDFRKCVKILLNISEIFRFRGGFQVFILL